MQRSAAAWQTLKAVGRACTQRQSQRQRPRAAASAGCRSTARDASEHHDARFHAHCPRPPDLPRALTFSQDPPPEASEAGRRGGAGAPARPAAQTRCQARWALPRSPAGRAQAKARAGAPTTALPAPRGQGGGALSRGNQSSQHTQLQAQLGTDGWLPAGCPAIKLSEREKYSRAQTQQIVQPAIGGPQAVIHRIPTPSINQSANQPTTSQPANQSTSQLTNQPIQVLPP